MTADIGAAVEAMARLVWQEANPDYPIRDCDEWQSCLREARRYLTAAMPHIERQVREKVAQEIEAADVDDIPLPEAWYRCCEICPTAALEMAADIARGKAKP